ncbi:MAG: TRL-like family protein [Muribaculaceae bacterium]|nr:TRL-like family protein [Muribaculaceae bacterium]
MRKVIITCLATCALTLASCSTISTRSGVGVLYTGVKEGEMVTSNQLGDKVGTASSIGVLGLVNVGDASIQNAANSAGIKKISHVDAKKTSVLGLFASYKIFVYGE